MTKSILPVRPFLPILPLLLALSATAAAQAPAKAPAPKPSAPPAFQQTRQPGDVETDPIKCYWKTDRSTIIVGERFTVVLTCGIIETDKIKAVPDFNQLEASTSEYVAAAIAFGFAIVLLGLAIVRVVSRYRVRTPASERALGPGTVLGGCLREAGRVTSDAEGGWTPELASRALTVLRIGGAVALNRPVAQLIVDSHVPAREGQL